MNYRVFSLALLLSSLPHVAEAGITFEPSDFTRAARLGSDGQSVVSATLSKSGKSKLRKLNGTAVGKVIHAEIGGVSSDFRLREPIQGDSLEMGPYDDADAAKVIRAINGK